MKKTTMVIVAASVAILLIIAVLFTLRKRPPITQQATAPTSQQQAQTPAEQPKQGVISSIKDAMGLGKQMKCTYVIGTGENKFESTAFVDGKKFKSSSVIGGKATTSYFDGEAMYIWMEGQKTGTKMTMSCINDLKASLPQDGQPPADVKAPDDQFNNAVDTKCEPATGMDFSLPTDVTFTDQCEMLKNLQNKLPANMPKLPAGANIPKY